MLFSIGVLVLDTFDIGLLYTIKEMLLKIDFSKVLLEVMLSFLLFAGALHTNFDQLKVQRAPILAFATFGVIVSTILIGGAVYYLLGFMGIEIQFIHALLFGALISPTDPIAVLGILKKVGVPKKLETKIVGESLFNDGVGVVVFLSLFAIASKGVENIAAGDIALLLVEEIGGGILLGAAMGYLAYRLMKSIDDYSVELLISLAIVMGGYLLAVKLHISGPLAVVVAGLIVGHDTIRNTSMSEITETYIDKFWEIIDAIMNGILFVMIGLEILVLDFNQKYILVGIILIPVVLLARYIALSIPINIYKKKLEFVPNTNLIMTWGGLRGGISIALALSLATTMNKELIIVITYVIVVFSIIIQGLSIGKVANYLIKKN